MSREALVDQLMRGALSPADVAARQGGVWLPIVEHPDLQSFFLPGAADAAQLVDSRVSQKRERRSEDFQRVGKLAGALVAAAASVGFAVFAVQQDMFIVPEEHVEELLNIFARTEKAVTDQVVQAVDINAAAEAVDRKRALPGEEVLTALKEKWPAAGGAAHLHLQRGLAGIWSGARAALPDAREHIEQAVVLAPHDVEAWSALAEVYALSLVDEPELGASLSLAVDRALALSPDATSPLRAAAMSAFAHGNRGAAADLANRCAAAPGTAGLPTSTSDLGCALVAAESQGMLSDLQAIQSRLPGHLRVELPLARVLLEKERYRAAAELASTLQRMHPKEVGPLEVRMDAHAALGEWEDARKAGEKAVQLAPHRVDLHARVAEIYLKVNGSPKSAVDAYKTIIEHPRFALLPNRPRILADAASAYVAAGKYAEAVAAADAALVLSERDPIAGLHKARALQKMGKAPESEALLRATEPTGLTGHTLAAWHVAAASFYIDAGRERLAEAELRSAGETDAFWPAVPIEAARNRLNVGDRDGAISFLEQAAYMDLFVDQSRNPMQVVWTESTDWRAFRRALENELLVDARFASRGNGVIGILSVYAGFSDARRVLERALAGGAEAPAANAALAQMHMQGGDSRLAVKHASQVVDTSANPGILHGIRGRANARMGDAAQSRAAFVQALEKSPNEATLYRWRAEAQLEGDDTRGARKSLAEALRLMPDDLRSKVLMVDLREDAP